MFNRARLSCFVSIASASLIGAACGPADSSSALRSPANDGPGTAIVQGAPTDEAYPEVCAVAGYVTQAWIDMTGLGEIGKLQAFCSGVLISPTVLATAGHCSWFQDFGFYSAEGVTCAPRIEQGSSLVTGHFVRHPAQEWFLGFPDVAVYVLDRPVQTRRYAHLPPVGALEDVFEDGERGPPITLVGYGISESSNVADTRRVTRASFALLDPGLGLVVTANPGLPAMHDSGGPAYLAASKSLLGTTSSGGEIEGRPAAAYARWDVPVVRDWVEQLLHPD